MIVSWCQPNTALMCGAMESMHHSCYKEYNNRVEPRSGLVVYKRNHWGPLYTNHWVGPRSGLDVKPSGLMCEHKGSKVIAV